MMGNNGPEAKRPRLSEPAAAAAAAAASPPLQNPSWRTAVQAADASRDFPRLPPPPPFHQHPSPQYQSHPPHESHPLDRRRPSQNEHAYDHQDPRSRPSSVQRNEPQSYHPQEPPRPHSGPAHGYNGPNTHHGLPAAPPPAPSYRDAGHRDPMVDVKRDPSDEPSQLPFKNSPGPLQERSVGPSPVHDYHRMAPMNSMSPGPSPHPYRSGPYPPQSPMAPPPEYGTPHHPPNYGPPTPSAQYHSNVSYPPPPQPAGAQRGQEPKRKAQRAAQACDQCRALKGKCDEGRPSCGGCKDRGTECHYRDPPPKQQDKSSADMVEGLGAVNGTLLDLVAKFRSLENRDNKRVRELEAQVTAMQRELDCLRKTKVRSRAQLKQEFMEHSNVPQFRTTSNGASQSVASSPTTSRPALNSIHPQSVEGPSRLPNQDEAENNSDGQYGTDGGEEGEPVPVKPPAMPVNHTTGAARLLQVPAIKALLRLKREPIPLAIERKRGLLRLFGRGEGNDLEDRDLEPIADNTPGDGHSTASSPATMSDDWGAMGGLTPPGNPPADFTRGVIDREGMPDFSRETVLELVESYKRNINNMHPLLAPQHLDKLVEKFLKVTHDNMARPKGVAALAANSTSFQSIHAGFTGVGGAQRFPESPSHKRKRSPATTEVNDIPLWEQPKVGHPPRSINTCIVLLVLALGKMCLHKERIPDLASDKDIDTPQSPNVVNVARNGLPPSPLQSQSSPSTSTMPSPQLATSQPRSRRSSADGGFSKPGTRFRQKNIDVIPGLVYFAFATDVIGNQIPGNTLEHVYACILASLYHGQLARVLESWKYLMVACASLQIILDPKIPRLAHHQRELIPIPAQDNPLVFAFWTCLQLESDILAEIKVPHTGILNFEEDMPAPNLLEAVNEGFDSKIIESYNGQLWLRKHLNRIHSMFYRPDTHPGHFLEYKKPFDSIDMAEESLNGIVNFSPTMSWDTELGEPSSDILDARLRAKFYGARVITYRPYILQVMAISDTSTPNPEGVLGTEYKDSVYSIKVNTNAKSIDELDPELLSLVRKGLRALVCSTTAFHNVGDPGTERLMVTNVWGTAHAQWGNIVTLSAASLDPILRPLFEEVVGIETLYRILGKTMAFLNLVATPQSALAIDLKLLKHVAIQIGYRGANTPGGPNTTSSFGSTPGDVVMSEQ